MRVLNQSGVGAGADSSNIQTIADYVQSGKCILFLGAGVHFPSEEYNYPEGECPPLGSTFSAALAAKCGFAERFPRESPTNLQRVSQFFEIKHSRPRLIEEIWRAVHEGKRPSPALRALAALPFQLVITTNYDQLFEQALHAAGKEPRVGVYSPKDNTPADDYNFTPEEPFVFKLHGDVRRPETIVITDEDYIQFVLRMGEHVTVHPVPETFRYHLKRWPTLFVGYSLLDYNLRLLFKTLRWKVDRARFPLSYAVDPYPDPLILAVWQNQNMYVTFIAQDVWAFVPELYRRVRGEEMPE